MGRRAPGVEEYRVSGVVERLAPYDVALVDDVSCPEAAEGELVERAATLLRLMPRNQRRETIEDLVCPNDRQRGSRAVEALTVTAFALEDESGRLRRVCTAGAGRCESDPPAEAPGPSALANVDGGTPTRREYERGWVWLRRALRGASFVSSSEK